MQKPIANRIIDELNKEIENQINLRIETLTSAEDDFLKIDLEDDLNDMQRIKILVNKLVIKVIKTMQTRIDKMQIDSCTSQTSKNDEECMHLLKNKQMLNEYYESESE